MQFEPWEIPIMVTALLVAPALVVWLVRLVRNAGKKGTKEATGTAAPPAGLKPERRAQLRTTGLAVLTVTLILFLFAAAGSQAAGVFTSVASGVSSLVSAVLTVQSFYEQKKIGQETDAAPNGKHAKGAAVDPGPAPAPVPDQH